MNIIKRIGLVAHDSQKKDLVAWVDKHSEEISKHQLICTGTTGAMIKSMLEKKHPDLHIDMKILKSGPLGGDQQMGALITYGEVDFIIFLTDPMTPMPHDVDVKALIRIAIIYNLPMACNLTTAEYIISSPLFKTNYKPEAKDYSSYLGRVVK